MVFCDYVTERCWYVDAIRDSWFVIYVLWMERRELTANLWKWSAMREIEISYLRPKLPDHESTLTLSLALTMARILDVPYRYHGRVLRKTADLLWWWGMLRLCYLRKTWCEVNQWHKSERGLAMKLFPFLFRREEAMATEVFACKIMWAGTKR